uniref:PAS domain-containing sensor histidine kinase n=1 Tax=Aliarcobacter sp. TaxID=2321116 RepID=UPI00404808DD
MFFRNKKKYSLIDIQKLFSQIPPTFIMLLASLLLIIAYFILDAKKNRQIDLIKQKYLLQYEFDKKVELNKFINNVDQKVKETFLNEEKILKRASFKVIGYLESKSLKRFDEVQNYLNDIEKKYGIEIVIFKEKNLEILHGKKSISYLQNIVFNTSSSRKYEEIILQYIYSQGKNNLQYWNDDLNKTIRFSFFDNTIINDQVFYIGSFSTINSIKEITRDSIIKTINNSFIHIWFYDLLSQNVYNYKNLKELIQSNSLLDQNNTNKSFEVLKHYFTDLEYKSDFKNYTYLYPKYNFLVTNFYDKKVVEGRIKNLIADVEKEHVHIFSQVFLYVLVVTTILLIFTFIFTNFIKTIFTEYNDELQTKTTSLEHWKKRFELAIIASNDGLWDIDFKTKKIYFSEKWFDMFGYTEQEVSNFSDWFGLIHTEDKIKVQKLFDEIDAKVTDTIICEYRLKTKNDGFKWVLARGKSFPDENGNLDRMLMMSMDIDKSKRMKKELLDVELLVEDGQIVIFKLNNDDNLSVKFISNSIKNYGFTKKEFESQYMNFMDLIYKDDINLVKVALNAALKKDLAHFTFVCRAINAADEIRWISCRTILIKNYSGDVIYFYGYINDITKIKVSEEELKLKVEEELSKNRQKDRILIQQSKLAAMGEMLGNIAHQWRQPLNNVSLILQFLRDNYNNKDVSDEKLDKFMEKANKHIEYMSETIDDFRNFYKPSKTQNEFSIKECVESLLYMFRNQYENIEINFKCEDAIITNYENELKQAILNILNNAKDAINQKKENEKFDAIINIDVFVQDNKLKIKIFNNGGNIPSEIIDRVFEPYFTTKFEHQGTGIGLYMTKSIIETNMRGKIEVENFQDGVYFITTLDI